MFSRILLGCLFIMITNLSFSQIPISMETPKNSHPCAEISEYPDAISDNLILARMIEGLGFRYYWVTEGLRAEDLAFLPGNDGRSTEETLAHLYNLSNTIINAVQGKPNVRPQAEIEMTFDERRMKALNNFDAAVQFLKRENADLKTVKVIFQRGEKTAEFPIWNLINGPITDAIYHCGQIVSFRRSSGNPITPGINVFSGKQSNQ